MNDTVDLNLFLLPYDTARRGWRMGQGPEHFLHNGLPAALEAAGRSPRVQVIETDQRYPVEIATAFELYGKLAAGIRAQRRPGQRVVALSGNCGAALGTISGITGAEGEAGEPGVIWFDAHGDFNTPETTRSGYLDGMGLATAAGLCWKHLAAGVPGFRPVAGHNILHVGGSDIEPEEESLMRAHGAARFSLAQLRAEGLGGLIPALDRLRETVSAVYLHLDLDVLHPAETRANHFPAADGMLPEQVKAAISLIRERLEIRAVGVASYDPAYDPQGRTLRAGIDLVSAAVGEV